ncbi:MAG: radical SAM protein [Oscillospiraceae bacterium]|nr:radical SAM protein [Oscillospiraceae bacterium]
MQIIKQGDSRVTKIVNKKNLSSEAEYRLSLYTYLYSENGRYLIRSTLSFEVTELTEAEWNAVAQIKAAPVCYDFIAENGLEQLAMSRYIVETGHDEVRQYQQTVFLLKTMAGKKKGLASYTILPTTGCNARCIYCYEEGYPVCNMTPETADRLVEFICETRQEDTIKLRWFGGEPLANAKIISRICQALQERGVPYQSDMVTNASLLTKELAHEAKELWHLKKVQVSLDGAKEDYTLRKNYYNPEKHNYDVVLRAVHYFADEGIRVNLRVNVDFENIFRIPGFL